MRMLRARAGLLFSVLLFAGFAGQAAEHETAAAEAKPEKGKDVAIEAIDAFIAKQDIDKSNPAWKTRLSKPPQVEVDSGKTYY